MTKQEHETLHEIVNGDPWKVRERISLFLKEAKISEEKGAPTRTDAQSRALFLWFSMIEKEAENQGITWDVIIAHTHQLKITKEGLHGMCKTLQDALFKTKSTKEIKKTGQLDIIIDHFVDLFSKVGLEVPPFPHDSSRDKETMGGYKTEAGKGTSGILYPKEDNNLADKFD